LVGEAIVSHLGLFDSLIATDRGVNVKGRRKAVQIRKALNCNEFDYIGDHMADVPVFEVARLSYLVAASPSLRAAATRVGRVEREFHLRSERFSTADPR
jgi:phosphoserine phosphatase